MRGFAAVALAVALAGCARPDACEAEVLATTARICAEVADTGEERARGLMGRDSLAPARGMLFLWPGEEAAARGFFMFRTLIPLDLVVIRSGSIVEVHRLEPCPAARAGDCPVTRTAPADAVLEVAAGVAAGSGLAPGSRVEVRSP